MDLNKLKELIKNKEAIVLIGAGVSINATKNEAVSSWKGLVYSGLDRIRKYGNPKLSDEDYKRLKSLMKTNDIDVWLSVASIIERKLREYGHKGEWLNETIGKLTVKNEEIIEAIHSLELPIITTNYDSILSEGTSKQIVTWKDPDRCIDTLNRKTNAVIHLHGHYSDPESIIFGLETYSEIKQKEKIQVVQKALSLFNSLILVGYGQGLDDPNFGNLLKWLEDNPSKSNKHIQLVLEKDLSKSKSTYIQQIAYGRNHSDLSSFIESLAPASVEHRYFLNDAKINSLNSFDVFKEAEETPEMVIIPEGDLKLKFKSIHHTKSQERKIKIENKFAVSKTPITFMDWSFFNKSSGYNYIPNNEQWGIKNRPLINVSWEDAKAYVHWLSLLTKKNYRLLSEGEWEYLAYADDTKSEWSTDYHKHCNFDLKHKKTTRIDKYAPNKFGLYDMLGNVWEWVEDDYIPDYNKFINYGNPLIRKSEMKVLKGGCWYYAKDSINWHYRIPFSKTERFNSIGFRIARELTSHSIKFNGQYIIESRNSENFLSLGAKGNLIQDLGKVNLKRLNWLIKPLRNNLYKITSLANGKALTLKYYTKTEKIKLENWSGENSQKWKIEQFGDSYIIINSKNNKALDVIDASKKSKSIIGVFSRHGNSNQLWSILKMS